MVLFDLLLLVVSVKLVLSDGKYGTSSWCLVMLHVVLVQSVSRAVLFLSSTLSNICSRFDFHRNLFKLLFLLSIFMKLSAQVRCLLALLK